MPCLETSWPACHTLVSSERFGMMAGIGSKLDRVVSSCVDMHAFCYNDTSLKGQIVRYVCPHTCGVTELTSGLFLSSPKDGVEFKFQLAFIKPLMHAPCEDPPLMTLLALPGWRR